MPWESDEVSKKSGRDWAKYMWLVVAVLIGGGVAAMFLPHPETADVTRAHVAHILIKLETTDETGARAALDKINKLHDDIVKGASFAKLAAQYSDDPQTASKGGDLGWLARGELAPSVEEYVWNAPLNQVSKPIATNFGLHLVIVYARKISKADQYEMDLKNRVLHEPAPSGTPAQ